MLSEEQKKIVDSREEKICCIACPGSGKTHTLIHRILGLVQSGDANPKEIVVVTYTVDAAGELRSRLLKHDITVGFVGTMHSYLLSVLNSGRCPITAGRKFTLFVSPDEASQEFRKHANVCGYKGAIGALEDLKARVAIQPVSETPQGAELVVRSWMSKQMETGLLDFDGIVFWGLAAITSGAIYPVKLFWDEAQDMSETDIRVFNAIRKSSWFVVGDPDQSIFGFRGGSPKHLEKLSRENGVVTYSMQTTRRCAKRIASSANLLMMYATGRESRSMTSESEAGSIEFALFDHDRNSDWHDFVSAVCSLERSVAFLTRTNFEKQRMIEMLNGLGVPVSQVERPRFPVGWIAAKYLLNALAFPHNDYMASEYAAMASGRCLAMDIRAECAKARIGVSERYSIPKYSSVTDAVEKIGPFIGDAASAALVKVVERSGVETLPELVAVMTQIERETTVEGQGIVVSTMHAAKGREWDNVIIAYANEKTSKQDPEEERRLMFVAATRARKSLRVVAFERGMLHQFQSDLSEYKISPFVKELGL